MSPPPETASPLATSETHESVQSTETAQSTTQRGPKPLIAGRKGTGDIVALYTFVIVPLLALLAAIPLAWSVGFLGWRDLVIAIGFYVISGIGVTVGFHRYLTHGAFKAKRWLRITLATAGSLAIEMSPTPWVAAHRRHHQFSDKEGDPHSPWRFGKSLGGVTKGFFYAHTGWLFDREKTNPERFAPDLLADKDIRRVDKLFLPLVLFSVFGPAVIGGLWSGSWYGALTGFFWGGLVRIALLHHVTWSVNSVCHMIGERPFKSNDRAANFWPLAIASFGESWHNSHHADPSCARHGVLRGQIDISARVIWLFEKFGWVNKVKWPKAERLAAKRIDAV